MELIGHDFWTDISDWNGTAHEVMCLLGEHVDNGLREVRETAKDRMVDHLHQHGAVVGNRIRWDAMLDLVLNSPGQTAKPHRPAALTKPPKRG